MNCSTAKYYGHDRDSYPCHQGHIACAGGRDVAQAVEHSDVRAWILLHGESILHGLFSVPTSGPQLVHQRLWYVLFCGKVHIKDPFLLTRKSSPCGDSGFPLKKYVKNYHMLDIQ